MQVFQFKRSYLIIENSEFFILHSSFYVFLTAIDKSKTLLAIPEIRLTNSAKKAFERVGREGPWNKEQLFNVIHSGNYNNIATTQQERVKLMEVMEDIIIFRKSFDGIKYLHFDHVCKKIRKATKDLMTETIN